MKVSDIGAVVRAHRKLSGISQKDLAAIVGVSRATLNYLESGREIEIGAGRLFEVLEVLGIDLVLQETSGIKADAKRVDQSLKSMAGKGRKALPRPVLVEALTVGRVPIGMEEQVTAFVDQAPDDVLLAAIRVTAAESGLPAKEVWKNGRSLAKTASSDRLIWRPKDSV